MQNSLVKKLTWEDVKEIVTILEAQDDVKDERELYSRVVSFLNRKYNTLEGCKDRFKEICVAAENATGSKYKKTRSFEQTVLHSFIAYQLRKEGYPFRIISAVMGYDHSTIVFYLKKLDDILSLPIIYSQEVRMFEDFKLELEK